MRMGPGARARSWGSQRLSAGRMAGASFSQGREEFGFGLDDVLDGAEEADVGAGDAGDDGGVGGGDAAVGLDFAADLGAHFDDGEAVVGEQPGEGGGDADVGVFAAVGGEGEAVSAEGGGEGLLGGGLAVAAGDADEGGGGAVAKAAGELLEGGEGVGSGDLAPGGVFGVDTAAEGCGCAVAEGVADVVVAVDAGAGQGDEEHAGLDAAAVEVGGGDFRVGGARREWPVGGGVDVGEFEHGGQVLGRRAATVSRRRSRVGLSGMSSAAARWNQSR